MKTDLYDHIPLVYVIGSDERGPVKIGITARLPERMRSLQVASAYHLKVFGVRFASSRPESGKWEVHAMFRRGAQRLENAVHRKLRELGLSMHGEWFDLGAADALAVIEKVGKTVGPRAVSLTDLLGVALSGRADPAMEKMHRRLMHEGLAINGYILQQNGT